MRDGPDPERGFTLIEILAALVIAGLLFGGLYSFYLGGANTWQKGVRRMDNQQNARIALDYLVEELRFACNVEITAPHEIKFRFKDDPKTYLFRRSGEEIVYESRNGYPSHNKIALGITGLSFEWDSGECIKITVVSGTGNEQVTMSSSIRPRNMH